MSIFRTCKSHELATGASKCPYNREKIVGAIVVAHGFKLPLAALSNSETLEEACHADRPNRIMPIKEFVEYAKNGGEVQVSAVGYGPNQATDVSAWTDAFTLMHYNEALNASLLKTMNTAFDVFFYDRNNVVYGMNLTDTHLEGFPMSSIYPTNTPFPTSGAKETLVVNFCYKDARLAMENANFMQADFDINSFACGLTPVKFEKTADNAYKIVEAYGGLDRTAEFGQLLATAASTALTGVTGATYNNTNEVITVTGSGTPKLAAPSVLYSAGIKGIEFVE